MKTLADEGSLKMATGFVAFANNGGAKSSAAMKSAPAPRRGIGIVRTRPTGDPRLMTTTTPAAHAGKIRTSTSRMPPRSTWVIHDARTCMSVE
jgi:hypothetical protein